MSKEKVILYKLKLFLFFTFVIIFLGNMLPIKANAEPIKNFTNVENTINTKTYKMGNDLSFKGVFSGHSWYFNINKWWNVNFVEAHIQFSINQLVDSKKDAYIVLSINNVNFYSKKIYYDEKTEIQDIKLNIPKDLLLSGSNELKVETYSRISDLPCIDDVNIANWITLKGDSNVKVNFNNVIADNKICNFPYPYLNEDDEDNVYTNIVIPNEYSDGELSAALLLNSYLGKMYENGDYHGEILKYDDFSKKKSQNVIYIGNYDILPKEISISNNVENEDCVIEVLNSPYSTDENRKMLLLLSNNNESLLKGVKTLMNNDIVFQLDKDTFIVDKNLKENMKSKEENGRITFKDIGSNEINLKGQFRRSATLNYSLPKNRVLSSGDKIKLFMRYSENLDFNKSLVTIYMNNTPIGSKKLEKDKANGDELELAIPDDVKLSSYMELTIAFDLEMENSYCEKRQEEMPWALVSGDSYIYTGLTDIDNYYFSTYGAPFIKDRTYNDTLVVLPDNLTSQDLTYIGRVFAYLGKDLYYNTGSLKAIRSSRINGEEKDSNIVVYGTPENNKLIKKLNNNLWFKYDEAYSNFLSNEKLFLTEPFSSEISTFQLDISPYNLQKAMLVITSPNEEILRNSLEYLSSSKKIYELSGDCAVIDQYGNIKTYKMKKEVSKPIYQKINSLDSRVKGLLGIATLFLIFIIISIIMYFLKNNSMERGNSILTSKLKKIGRKYSKGIREKENDKFKDK
ncbi:MULTISPECIES: cellulose biosynthesis cyclic di-GMP-binding regulatory protein BcsB [unclassified Clostridium]|uniref:cellulose biosynthesis cyclic di-GMP-binding regulatory protein BcsB n=1 Tax=unclassified Clostridium TaxID=2614128 RepID=UPI002079304C|nr:MULTISPECIES: cellulose biosynthesis cyclic di-GMP-binding regulatory protein BcsB [unclassified Clostridium]